MMTMDIQKILADHKKWLDGVGGSRADLSGADLSRANLSWANLSRANLSRANLSGSDLSGANLSRAGLSGAGLSRANLSRAGLSGAGLSGADLSRANLSRANLSRANLSGADLSGANLPSFQICPEEGDFIAWKKVKGGVLKLLIPASAKRTSSLVGRKCRAEFVQVLEGEGVSNHDGKTVYKPGSVVYPDKYDDDIRVECTSGIHFFMTRKEAEEY
jgi:Family of unknown function (DUF5758)/Pentapeptide repeats (8 copies)